MKMNDNESKQCEKEHKKDEKEVDEKTVVGYGDNDDSNNDGDHVNEKQ